MTNSTNNCIINTESEYIPEENHYVYLLKIKQTKGMNIGKTPLSNAEFTRLWSILYQEFHALSTTGTCNAAYVYSTIYRICTSTVSYEDKLYWKIGDFLHNRCKEHYKKISSSSNYLEEYVRRFKIYETLVRSIHKLGCFLNECVDGRKLDDFGFLLWERSVIQPLPETFFEDVYSYSGPPLNRIEIMRSFAAIIPDPAIPLLYYKEKYEKMALNHIRAAYSDFEEEDVVELSEHIHEIVAYESQRFCEFFLHESREEHEKTLAKILLGDKIGLILRIKAFLEDSICLDRVLGPGRPPKRFSIAIGTEYQNESKKAAARNASIFSSFTRFSDPQSTSLQPYAPVPGHSYFTQLYSSQELEEDEDGPFDFIFNSPDESIISMSVLHSLAPLVNKKTESIASLQFTASSVFHKLLFNFCSLRQGTALIKRAYICYLIETFNNSPELLSGSIPLLYASNRELDVFRVDISPESISYPDDSLLFDAFLEHSTGCSNILLRIIKNALQRVKPCFITRLCHFSDNLTLKPEFISQAEMHSDMQPFVDPRRIFESLVCFVPDKREFVNVYHSVMRERLLLRNSDIEKEKVVLDIMMVSGTEKLYKMVDDIERNLPKEEESSYMILLNYSYWNIEPDAPNITIPHALVEQIKTYYCRNEGCAYTKGGSPREKPPGNSTTKIIFENNQLTAKMLENEEWVEKNVKLAHQYSKITLRIGSNLYKMNMLQYVLLDAAGSGATMEELTAKTGLNAAILEDSLGGLLEEKIIERKDNVYAVSDKMHFVAHEDVKDISSMKGNSMKGPDFCKKSYLQALLARLLKQFKKMTVSELRREVMSQSKVQASPQKIMEAITVLAGKDLCEVSGDVVEYIS